MDLGKKIQQVLKHYPSVYVRGLGSFIKVHQPSSFDEQHNVFLPPVDYIEFDDRADDGLDLAEYLRQENEISKTDAQDLVAREVEAIASNITEHGKAHIPQLGDLLAHGAGYVFRAIDLSSFAFEPISNIAQPIQVTDQPEQDNITSVDEPEDTSISEKQESTERDLESQAAATSEELAISSDLDKADSEEQQIEEESVVIADAASDQIETDTNDVTEEAEAESAKAETESTCALPHINVPTLEEEFGVAQHTDERSEESEQNLVEESVSQDLHSAVTVPEAPPLVQNKYQGSLSSNAGKSTPAPEILPSSGNDGYTYASEYVEDTNRSQKIWYILAAVVALSVIGALWYVTRPVSLYSDISQSDMEDEQRNPYAIDEEYQVPPASADVIDTSAVLRERPDTANVTSSTAAAASPLAMDQPIIPANHHWYIVIGSRLPLDDAKQMVQEYNKKGQTRVRLIPGKGTDSPATVIWDSYVTKEKADSALRHVRKNFVADAWHKAVRK